LSLFPARETPEGDAVNTVPRAGRRGPTRSPLKAPSRCKPCAAIAWSGGKDSCHALARADTDYNVIAMITMFDDDGGRSQSHGLRPEMIAAQAKRLQLQTLIGRCAWDADSVELGRVLWSAAALGVTHLVFGDIRFDAHRAWNERICAAHGLQPVFPLWRQPTRVLVEEFIGSGSTGIIVGAHASMLDRNWLGGSQDISLADRSRSDAARDTGVRHAAS
jgi:uncharacterized protein (TIGR00290 family)